VRLKLAEFYHPRFGVIGVMTAPGEGNLANDGTAAGAGPTIDEEPVGDDRRSKASTRSASTCGS
jgi:hypothetical protein